MKNKFLMKLSLTLCLGTVLFPLSANAYTYSSGNLSGTDATADYVVLGNGTRYVYGNLVNNYSGKAGIMMVKKWAPDSYVAKFSLSTSNPSGQATFTAKATNSDGVTQSYYRRWQSSSSKSKAWTAVSN